LVSDCPDFINQIGIKEVYENEGDDKDDNCIQAERNCDMRCDPQLLNESMVFWKPNRNWGLPVISINIVIRDKKTSSLRYVMGQT